MEEESPFIPLLGHIACWLTILILLWGSEPEAFEVKESSHFRAQKAAVTDVQVFVRVGSTTKEASMKDPPFVPPLAQDLAHHGLVPSERDFSFPSQTRHLHDHLQSRWEPKKGSAAGTSEHLAGPLAQPQTGEPPELHRDMQQEDMTEELLDRIISEAAERYGVDADLVRAIIKAESGYNARAISKKGAKGLMQLMPTTARALGVKDMFDPVHNINGGVKYFKQLLDRFDGDVKLALAAYNAGSRKVIKHQGIPPIKATRHYVKKVYRFYQSYKKQKEKGSDDA